MTKKRSLGARGEDAAAAFLEHSGWTVVERNWTCRAGEIDIVALDDSELVLVEVKTRRSDSKGTPEEAVGLAKQRRIVRLAREYVAQAGLSDIQIRFDVITLVVVSEDRAFLRHLRSAFVPEV